MADIAQLGFSVDSGPITRGTRALDGLTAAATRTETATGRAQREMTVTGRAATTMASQIERATSLVRGFVGAFVGFAAAREIVRLTDAYTNLNSKLRNVTESEEELVRVRKELFALSQRTRQEYAGTVDLYSRLTRATAELALTEQQRLTITETINKAAIVSGATAQEAEAAIRQLSQGIASGALRGEEFNSVAEQMPILLDLVAKATGRSRGELRSLAAEGRITASVLTGALLQGAESVNAQFANMEVTIGGAMTVLRNSIGQFVGEGMQGSEAASALADSILAIAQAIELVAPQINGLIRAWRGQSDEQAGVATTARSIAEGMKVVVTGLVIAKNAVDILVAGLRALVGIGAAAAEGIIGNFRDVASTLPEVIKALRNPLTIGAGLEMIDDFYARAEKRAADFLAAASEPAADFGATWQQSVTDVADAFAFLQAPMTATTENARQLGPATQAAAGGVIALGESAEEAEKRITKLATAQRALADLIGGIGGAVSPVDAEQEKYNKLARDAIALKEKIIKLGGDEAAVTKQVSAALAQAAKNRDKELASLKKKQGAADALLATLRDEVDAVNQDAEARENLFAAMRAEEDMLRAIESAREAGKTITEEQAREHVKLARSMAIEGQEAARLQAILEEFNETPMTRLVKEIRRVGDALREATDPETVAQLQTAMDGLQHSMRVTMIDSATQGLQSLQSMTKNGSKAFAAMQVAIDALAVAQAISAVLNQGQGDPYTAFARMAAMAAAVATLVGNIGANFGGSGVSSSSAEVRQAAQGRGTVLGDAEAQSESIANATEITAEATSELVGINRGMLTALLAMQAGISGAAAGLARTGFAELSLDAGTLLGSIFGGDQDLIDQGVLIGGGTFGNVSRNPSASTFQTIETDGGWFSGDDVDDVLESLTDGATTQIRLILESIGDAVREGAVALGLDAEEVNRAIEQFRLEEIRISTMGLTGEEAQAELEAVFSTIFDGLAAAVVPFVTQFQQVGEGLGETLVRVATSVQVTQEAITQLGLAIGTLEPEMLAQVSVGLIEAAGGIEEFITGMQSFVSNFAPESHQFEVAQDQITRAFAQVGLTLPDTREGLWALMQSLDATTASGREQIATLLRLSATADDYYDHLESSAEAATRAAEEQREAARSYLDFVRGFDATGSDFQRSLTGLQDQFRANVAQANELARAAGLQAARTEDLQRIEAAYFRQREQAIQQLTATVQQQISELYGTSAEKLEQAIAEIDAELSALDRSDSSFGFVQAFLREQALQQRRAGLVTELEQQRAAEEGLRRQTAALDLAQNLADLTLARGVSFSALATELGLDVSRFGADLGLTAEGVNELIATLQTESLTSDVFDEGIDRLIDALLYGVKPGEDGLAPPKSGTLPEDTFSSGAKMAADAPDMRAALAEVRVAVVQTGAAVVQRLDRVGSNTGDMVEEQRQLARGLRGDAMDEVRRIGRSVRVNVKSR